jgi:hypothetical protein
MTASEWTEAQEWEFNMAKKHFEAAGGKCRNGIAL